MTDKGIIVPTHSVRGSLGPRRWFREFAFLRPRWEAVVMLLGLAAFWGGVLLKLLS